MILKAGKKVLLIFATMFVAGCGSIQIQEESYEPPYPSQPVFSPPTSGSIYNDGLDVRLFEDRKATRVGDITVTVVARYPNGNLRIRGEKWLTLNQGREFIRLSGIIRPDDVGFDNSIESFRIADAQISYSSKGVLAAANRMGLISRFFNSIFHPY